MQLRPFSLERYFAEHEFRAPYLLSASDCETMTLPELLSHAGAELSRQWNELPLGYTESAGHPRLRASIAELYAGLTSEDVLEVVPCEGILLTMLALLRDGGHVVASFPTYQSLHEVARSLGCEVTPWSPRESLDRLVDCLRNDTRLVIVNFPHNPTGATLPHSDFARLLAETDRRGIPLFSDEMYRYSEYEESDRLSSACELSESAISLGGLSKSFGLPGLRVGWLASRNRSFLARAGELKDYTTLCASAPSEVLALVALSAREAILARNRGILQRNLAVLDDFFARHRERFTWARPRAGPVCLVEHRLPGSDQELADRLRLEQGVLIAVGSHFGADPGTFRVGFGRRNLPDALARFERIL